MLISLIYEEVGNKIFQEGFIDLILNTKQNKTYKYIQTSRTKIIFFNKISEL